MQHYVQSHPVTLGLLARVSPLTEVISEATLEAIERISRESGLLPQTVSAFTYKHYRYALETEQNLKDCAIAIGRGHSGFVRGDGLVAYSLIGWAHSRTFRIFEERLKRAYGNGFDSREMDTNYFAGRNDFHAVMEYNRDNTKSGIFRKKTRMHIRRATDIWERTKDCHKDIAFRYTRAAAAYLMLYELGDDSALPKAEEIIYHAQRANIRSEKDAKQTARIVDKIADVKRRRGLT